jgi:hypothetical protein
MFTTLLLLLKISFIFILTFCIFICYTTTTVIFEIILFINKTINCEILNAFLNYKSILFIEIPFWKSLVFNSIILFIILNYLFIPFIFYIKNTLLNFFFNIINFINYILKKKNELFYLKQYKSLVNFNIKKILINTAFIILFIFILFGGDFLIQYIELKNLHQINFNYFNYINLILIIYTTIHIILGLYMIYYDYLKNDAFILFLISIYILFLIIIFLNIKNISNINLNMNLDQFNSYLNQNFINKKINIFIL